MRKIRRRFKKLRILLSTNLLKTIWLNYKVLPMRQAVKLPIYLYGKTTFRSLTGRIIINGPISTGMIKIGKNDYYVDTSIQHSIWNIRGNLIFNGPMRFLRGGYLLVADNATLTFGSNGTFCGSNTKIMCFDSITIGDNCRITWNCQIYDTSFHYIELLNKDGEVKKLTKPICVGENVWIGNSTTIAKGAVIPDNTIVASNSLVNKDFSDIEPYSLIAGCPAGVKATGCRRVWDTKLEREFDRKFGYTRTHL